IAETGTEIRQGGKKLDRQSSSLPFVPAGSSQVVPRHSAAAKPACNRKSPAARGRHFERDRSLSSPAEQSEVRRVLPREDRGNRIPQWQLPSVAMDPAATPTPPSPAQGWFA